VIKSGIHKIDVDRAENYAGAMEGRAASAIDYAIASVELAKLSVLDAILARVEAETTKRSYVPKGGEPVRSGLSAFDFPTKNEPALAGGVAARAEFVRVKWGGCCISICQKRERPCASPSTEF
jgi:hypothetical protein